MSGTALAHNAGRQAEAREMMRSWKEKLMREMRGGAVIRVRRAGVCVCVCVRALLSLPPHLRLSEHRAHVNSDTDTHSRRHIRRLYLLHYRGITVNP